MKNVFLFVALLTYCVVAQVLVSDWDIITGTMIQDPNAFTYFSYANITNKGILLNTTVWPCFGAVNAYSQGGSLPTQTNYNQDSKYMENTIISEIYLDFSVNPSTNGYTGVQAALDSLFNTENYAAKFDLTMTILDPTAPNGYLTRMPIVGDQISFSKDTDLNLVYITYTPTGNSLDQYSYYRYNQSYDFSTSGFVSGTACGVKEFMELAYPTNVVTNSDSSVTATFTVLYNSPDFDLNSFIVLVTRNCTSLGIQCYQNVFYRVDVNSSDVLRLMSWSSLLLLAYLLMLLLK